MRLAGYCLGAVTVLMLAFGGAAHAEQSTQAFQDYGLPALRAINDAYVTGEIDRATALQYRVYYCKSPELLPEKFHMEGGTLKSGTPILLQAYEELEAMGRGDLAGPLRSRPTGLTMTRTTTHFIIHYTTSGGDAVSEAFVDDVEDACETAWSSYHNDYNWDVVPGDGSAGGGYDMIDCYIHSLGPGLLGMAEPESSVPPNPPHNDKTGFFHVNSTISSLGDRLATTAHEYMHVVQFGYNSSSVNSWWMENCAMMGEEFAYDTINDYRGYLSFFFGPIYEPLYTHNGQYEYGQITWPMYHAERFTPDLVRDLWDRLQWAYSFWDICDDAFAPYGYDIDSAYAEFMRWCVYTNYRDDGNHFEEAGTWNSYFYPDNIYNSYPQLNQGPDYSKRPDRVSSSFMAMQPESGSSDNVLQVDFDGPECTIDVTLFHKHEDEQGHTEYYMTLDANGDGTIQVPGFDETCDWVVMLVNMSLYCSGAQDYSFDLSTTSGGQSVDEGAAAEMVRVYPNSPNPVLDRTVLSYALPRASEVDVKIVDASGRLVRSLYSGDQQPGTYEMVWNRQNDSGQEVASGVYYALVRAGGQELTRQMTVLR